MTDSGFVARKILKTRDYFMRILYFMMFFCKHDFPSRGLVAMDRPERPQPPYKASLTSTTVFHKTAYRFHKIYESLI